MANTEPIDVAKRYGKQTMLQPLNLITLNGSSTVSMNPSGCGKSTLLRLLAGLETPSGGTILINKRLVNDLDPADRDVVMAFQSYALYPHLTVTESLAFHMQIKKADKQLQKSKVRRVVSLLGIDKLLARYSRALSDGQRQWVAAGRAMVRNPQVFLFDEPLLNLGAQLRMELRTEIKSFRQRINTTMIYVAHDQVEVMILADQIVVMRDGQIVQQGAPLATYDQPCNTFVARFISSPSMNLLPSRHAVYDGQPGVVCGTSWFPLTERWRQAMVQQGDAPLIVGLRPQGILSDAYGVPVTVNIMKVTGKSTLPYLDWQGFPMHVQVVGRVAVAAQQMLGLILRHENLHPFDAASGERLAEMR